MHTIRLRGPWEYRPSDSKPDVPYQRLKLPADWSSVLNNDQTNSYEFRRAFHSPTGIGENDRVTIVLEQLPSAAVTLNNQPLGSVPSTGSAEFSISEHLADRNELQIVISLAAGTPCHGIATIQIEETD